MNSRPICVFTLILFFTFGLNFLAFSEEFKVILAPTSERPTIDVDISNISNEEQIARKVGEEVLKRELGQVDFILESIKKENSMWVINYNWEYEGIGTLGHFFKVSIDLKGKTITYNRCR